MAQLSRVILTILLFLMSTCAVSQQSLKQKDIRYAETLRDRVLAENMAYDIVESLTSEVGARMGGTPGDKAAVAWAVKKFKAYKFDKVWTEPVSFPTWTRGVEEASIVAPYPHQLEVTALGGSIGTPAQGLQAELVHFKTYADLQAADEKTVAGKIVFISNRMTRSKDGSGYAEAVVARSRGAATAAEKGAVGIIIRSIGTDTARSPHTGYMAYEEGIAKIPAAAASNPDADLLVNILKRNQPVVVNLKLGSGPGPQYTSANVIAEIKGKQKPEEMVLLAAHLDSWDLGTGAIDDASGVAIIMEAARQIANGGKRPRRSIRVVLYANEEQGIYGGKEYAKLHANELSKIMVAAESDLGTGRIWRFSSTAAEPAKGVVEQIYQVLKPLGIEHSGKAHAGADISPLAKQGVPIVELSQDASMYFDYHHTPDDTLDKIDVEALKQNVAAYAVFAYLAAQSPVKFQVAQ